MKYHRFCLFLGATAVVLAVFSSELFAQGGVPRHLVPMAVDLLDSAKQKLKQGVGDTEHQELCKRAYKMVRQNGLFHWARGNYVQKGATDKIAASLGIETVEPEDVKYLQVFLDVLKEVETEQAIKDFYRSSGRKPPDGKRLLEMVEQVEKALTVCTKDLPTEYTIEGFEKGESIRLKWIPKTAKFNIHIIDAGDNDSEPFRVSITGNVNEKVSSDGGSIVRFVEPALDPIQAKNALDMEKDAEETFNEILGEWIDQNGDRWVIESRGEEPSGKYSRLVRLTHYKKSALLDWEGRFEFGQIKAKRKATHLMDTKEELPMEVRTQLIKSWQPMLSLELKTVRDKQTGSIELNGLYWSWLVTYDGSDYEVTRVHSPYSKPLSLTDEAVIVFIDFTGPDPPYESLDMIAPGDSFRVKVVFDSDPESDSESVTITNPLTGNEILVSAKQTKDALVFLTDPVCFELPSN